MFGAGLDLSWMIHHYCALLQILRRPGEAGFTDSLVAHLEIGISVVYEWAILCPIFPNQFSSGKWKNIVCLRLREIVSLTAQLEFLLLMPLRTSAIEGVLVKVTTSQASNALAQNVNRILSVPGGRSFRQCFSTSEKNNIFSNVFQWADPFLPMLQLGWTWAWQSPVLG